MKTCSVQAVCATLLIGALAIQVFPAEASTTPCGPNPPSGSTVNGSIAVPAGSLCELDHVTVLGSVIVDGYLSANDSNINGTVTLNTGATFLSSKDTIGGIISNHAKHIRLLGDTVRGVANFTGSSGDPDPHLASLFCATTFNNSVTLQQIGADTTYNIGGARCEGTIAGLLNVQNNAGVVSISTGKVSGSVNVRNNTGTGGPGGTSAVVNGVTISGSLNCSGNVGGVDTFRNVVSGAKTGQCAQEHHTLPGH